MRKRNNKISFWASDGEKKLIEKAAKNSGLGEGEFIRNSALGNTVVKIYALKPLLREWKAVGRNLNQLTVLAHEGRIFSPDLTGVLDLLGKTYDLMNALLSRKDFVIRAEDDDGDV